MSLARATLTHLGEREREGERERGREEEEGEGEAIRLYTTICTSI
jgi:hypothetical protein